MDRLVLDASAAAEYLLRTPLGQQVAALVEGKSLFAPALLDAEVLAVLHRAILSGRLSPKRAQEALEDLSSWPLIRVDHRPLLLPAFALRDRLSAYEALYAALAQKLAAPILTASGPLARVPGLPVPLIHLRL
ncbi:type II toxin-antitoxin system VapC family toxin [Thermus sediminis]|uniref:type II toxin-antitoxin system VapC family toxin n=1 Tax=Thermus sediminis TaxID=1761908 RepID=UPI000E3DA715|nr:type II toxin-antitoxin system VapC family toxin [Thermus sediminis]